MLRTRLSYANVMATVAVFLALGGGAYAITLKRNSVKSKTIAPDAAKGVDVDEATLGKVPDADKLDGLDSTGLATSAQLGTVQGQVGAVQTQLNSVAGEVLTGTVNPTSISVPFFTVPSMNLRVETDADMTGTDNIVVNDLDSNNDLAQFTAGGPSAIIGATTIAAPGDFGGTSSSQLDALISSGTANERLLIHCLFAQNRDYCYGIVGP